MFIESTGYCSAIGSEGALCLTELLLSCGDVYNCVSINTELLRSDFQPNVMKLGSAMADSFIILNYAIDTDFVFIEILEQNRYTIQI